VAVGVVLLLSAGAIGGVAYIGLTAPSRPPNARAASVAIARPAPGTRSKPAAPVPALSPVRTATALFRPPDHPHELLTQRSGVPAPAPAPSATLLATGAFSLPPQPVPLPPKELSSWAQSLLIALPPAPSSAKAPKVTAATSAPGYAATPAPETPPRVAASVSKPAVPSPAEPAPPAVAPAATIASLPSGTPLHLTIVYSPWAPEAASHVASLTARLQSQVNDIVTSGASVEPVKDEAVAYFFPADRAGATAVAASLARLTKRAEPVKLLRTQPPPRPGTIEILIPRNSGKDLTNESL
jgi:hypothetical protein